MSLRRTRVIGWVMIVAGSVAMGAPSVGFAQAPPPPPAPAEGRTRGPEGGAAAAGPVGRVREIVKELQLTAEQERQVEGILDRARDDFRALRDEMRGLDGRERGERTRAFARDVFDQVAGVLTEEQRQTFRERLAGAPRPPQPPRDAAAPPAGGGDEMGGPGPRGPRGPGGRPPPPGQFMQRLADSVAKLELSDEQKPKVEAILRDLREQADEIRAAVMAGDEMARGRAGEAVLDARQRLSAILTPEQQDQLRQMMRAAPAERGDGEMRDGPPRRRGPRRPGAGNADDGGMMGPDPVDPAQPAKPDAPAAPERPMPEVGVSAPDFDLKKLDGPNARVSAYQGRVLVIVFGSYSSPSFRQRAAGLEQLKKELGPRGAQFLVVYTREAHPAGQWDVERNKDEGITVPAHADFEARQRQAERAVKELKLSVPVALDDLGDTTLTAYGGATNGAVVIGRDGKVVARQRWFDPHALRRHIEQALKPAPAAAATRPAA